MKILQDKVAVVTGAGSGIGRSVALAYAREGAKVIVSDMDEDSGRDTVDLISGEGAGEGTGDGAGSEAGARCGSTAVGAGTAEG